MVFRGVILNAKCTVCHNFFAKGQWRKRCLMDSSVSKQLHLVEHVQLQRNVYAMEMLVKSCVLQFYNTSIALPLFRHMSIKCNLGKTDLPMSKTSHVLRLAFFFACLHSLIKHSLVPPKETQNHGCCTTQIFIRS